MNRCVNESEEGGIVTIQAEKVKKAHELKYVGPAVQSNGECKEDVKRMEEWRVN